MMSIPATCRTPGQIAVVQKLLFQERLASLKDTNGLKIFEDEFEFHGFQSPKMESLDKEVLIVRSFY